MRVAFMMEGFSPYRVPFWNSLSKAVALHVVLLSKIEKGRQWSINFDRVQCPLTVVSSPQLVVPQIDWSVNFSYGAVQRMLDELRPEVVIIGGWSSPGYWAGRNWARRNRIPLVFWSESHVLSTRTRKSKLLNAIKKWFLKPFAGVYAFSPLSAQYMMSFGISTEKIVDAYNLPDIDAFQEYHRIGDDGVPVLLYVGQLIKRKGLVGLFEELCQITDLRWRLEIAGDGPLRISLMAMAERYGFADRIRFLGFVQPEVLNDIYRSADVLLMPSHNEVWGLVLHEALLSGTFVIGSDRAAASHALIRPDLNGIMFSPFEHGLLAKILRRTLAAMPFDRDAIRRSVTHITVDGEVAKLSHLLTRVHGVTQTTKR